ncbi:MAG: hypothetical protein B7C24_10145 [Bacteroidetes bacterium 4572_77]|nr:MAG: hypothetical protein B7C24_10145 [Bacteroidetes bacterium 4572_77]
MIVIVGGMHRSGTSALAGLLHHNGIVMGEEVNFKPRPKKNQNAKGYYENFRFRSLNDRILEHNGYKVKSFDSTIPELTFTDAHVAEGKALVDEYDIEYKNWGWKDPRNSLTLKFWMSLCPTAKIVVSRRNYESIAHSMVIRNKGGKIEKYINLCMIYYNHLYANVGNNEWYNIFFEDLCNNTSDEVTRLEQFLNYAIEDLSFIESRLQHHA